MVVKPGDRIEVKPGKYITPGFKTKLWMENEKGTVLKVNNKTITVRFDHYPGEKHYIDYGDFDIIKECDQDDAE